MGISYTAKKLKHLSNLNNFKTSKNLHNSISDLPQHHANPISPPLYHPNSSTGLSSVCAKRYSSSSSLSFTEVGRNFDLLNSNPNRVCAKPSSDFGGFSNGGCSNLHFGRYYGCCRGSVLQFGLCKSYCCSHVRWFCGSSLMKQDRPVDSVGGMEVGKRDHVFREYNCSKMVSEVIELIRRNGDDLEAELEDKCLSLSLSSIIVIFRALSSKKVSLLRFFDWIRLRWPDYGRNADVCSLIICNCGWLGDYDSMLLLLRDFKSKDITLCRRAFDFVPVVISSKSVTLSSLEKLILLLNQVGGSCRSSGFQSLVEMFSLLGRFDLCEYVIRKSDGRNSYYYVMVKELCRRGDFDGAMDILDKMRQAGCNPDTSVYNNLLSRLCQVRGTAGALDFLEALLKRGFQPDELTYEILICFYCRNNDLDCALQFYDQMLSHGLKPRLTTHAAFINHYFNLKQYDEAYAFVASLTDKHKHLGNKFYSVLVNLHRKQQNLIIAHKMVSEMISRGLRPEYNVYKRLLHCLQKSGKENLVRDLEAKLCNLASHSSLGQ